MKVKIRYATDPIQIKNHDSSTLREHFLVENIMQPGQLFAEYTMYDRMMLFGVVPTEKPIDLPVLNEYTKAEYFLERREMGVINIGGAGSIIVDGKEYDLKNRECLYIGIGNREVSFNSNSKEQPAEFYANSCPAHKNYPTTKATQNDATRVDLGSKENCNERTIYQFIHEDGIESCQLVMGFTTLQTGSIWNTFPPHTHLRRMEAYFYFDIPEDQLVMHFMGEPNETRHIAVKNKQAVLSPEWSIHSGAGTASYSFIWSMAGENMAFTDMDAVSLKDIR